MTFSKQKPLGWPTSKDHPFRLGAQALHWINECTGRGKLALGIVSFYSADLALAGTSRVAVLVALQPAVHYGSVEESISLPDLPVARAQLPVLVEYFKGIFPCLIASASRNSVNDAPWETLSLRHSRLISAPLLTPARAPAGYPHHSWQLLCNGDKTKKGALLCKFLRIDL